MQLYILLSASASHERNKKFRVKNEVDNEVKRDAEATSSEGKENICNSSKHRRQGEYVFQVKYKLKNMIIA